MLTHEEAVGLYAKSFPFLNDLALVFTKDRAFGNNRGDIGDNAAQYEQDDDISLEEGASLSQMPFDDLPMPTQELIQDLLPMPSNNNTSTTSRCRKTKSVAKDPTMDRIFINFDAFVNLVGPEFKASAEATASNAESAARTAESVLEHRLLLGFLVKDAYCPPNA